MVKLSSVLIIFVMLSFKAWAGTDVTYQINGETFEGYSAKVVGKPSKGLVFLVHDWDGLTEYEKKRSDMLVQLGYDAFAVDLFGKGNRPKAIKDRRAATRALYKDRKRMLSLLIRGLKEATKRGPTKTVVIGYCFGGAAALEIARSGAAQGIAGYASFHGGLSTPQGQSYPDSTPPIFVAHGGADRAISMDQVAELSKELERSKLKYEIQVYSGAPHAFTVFGSKRYREGADKKSWSALQVFLKETMSR